MGSKQYYKMYWLITQNYITAHLWCIVVTKLKVRMEEQFLTTEKTTSKDHKQPHGVEENLNFITLHVKFQKVNFISSHSQFLFKCNMICWVLYIVHPSKIVTKCKQWHTGIVWRTHPHIIRLLLYITILCHGHLEAYSGLLYQLYGTNHNLQELCTALNSSSRITSIILYA